MMRTCLVAVGFCYLLAISSSIVEAKSPKRKFDGDFEFADEVSANKKINFKTLSIH